MFRTRGKPEARVTARNVQELHSRITWQEFEDLIADLVQRMGFERVIQTPRGSDGGKDIIAYRRDTSGNLIRYYIECKHRRGSIGRPVVQRLLGAVAGDKIAARGILITSGHFSGPAKEFAERSGKIELIDGDGLISLMRKHGMLRAPTQTTSFAPALIAVAISLCVACCAASICMPSLFTRDQPLSSRPPTASPIPKATPAASPTPVLSLTTVSSTPRAGPGSLRTGPDITFSVIVVLEPDTPITPIERTQDGKWWHVSITGQELAGWIHANQVSGVEGLAPVPTVGWTTPPTVPKTAPTQASPTESLPTPTTVPTATRMPNPTQTPTLTSTPWPTSVPAPSVRCGAVCRDGWRSDATGSGACSHHGGVAHWVYCSP